MGPQLTGMIAGTLAVLVALAAWAAVRPPDTRAVSTDRRQLTAVLARHRYEFLTVAAAVLVVVVTRMLVLGVAAAVALWLIPSIVAGARERTRQQLLLEATHAWLLQLRTVLAAGSGLEQAIIETAALQPDHSPLAPAAQRLATRVRLLGPIPALRGFAVEVNNHICDTAVTVLTNALSRQNVGVAHALDGLLEWAEQDVRQQRDIDARLQSVRTQRWMIIGIFMALATYFTAANPALMSVYATPLGQTVLAGILGVAALCLWALERMARPSRPPQFFAREEVG
jgi:pilus assembly protein TadC